MGLTFFFGICLLIGTLCFVSIQQNKRQRVIVFNGIEKNILFKLNDIKWSRFTTGFKGEHYFIRKCDLYAANDAIIISGKGSCVLIFSNNTSYIRKFPFLSIKSNFKFSFNAINTYATIKYSKKPDFSLCSEIILKTLTLAEQNRLKDFYEHIAK